jgi:hypothetical protein
MTRDRLNKVIKKTLGSKWIDVNEKDSDYGGKVRVNSIEDIHGDKVFINIDLVLTRFPKSNPHKRSSSYLSKRRNDSIRWSIEYNKTNCGLKNLLMLFGITNFEVKKIKLIK